MMGSQEVLFYFYPQETVFELVNKSGFYSVNFILLYLFIAFFEIITFSIIFVFFQTSIPKVIIVTLKLGNNV